MGTLKEDIKAQAKWIVEAFSADNLNLDGSIKSFIEIDRFFNKHTVNGKAKKGGRLSRKLGSIVFSIASYIIETILIAVPGSKLIADDDAPDGEITVSIQFPDGSVIFPVQKVMKRFENGSEDSIYVYGHQITKDYTNEPFEESYWSIADEKVEEKKKWWKFGK
jgi:hypothetical protein